ncbi:MAG: BTAD domain-containing putative transcriptional regulator [Alphaproteobacteria bacterium]|jgi:TolB-like protein/DNA-binding SARP family transcriptional activator|nr:BTAD domain-containing putative transcriptional regulator [Alphaproteobacteria bacterium]MDP6564541.1 BTAD domain-containing putative transcriptional regulator [Alphaproteobacteria bacterium]MDP6815757.1 BTAD domain-containing putative transcriptional regulator [Alphaproteobacteria bacterium]
MLKLELLGGFRLSDAGVEIPLRSRKARGLLAYLALDPDRVFPREHLANLLWDDRMDAQARQSLRQALTTLRQRLADHTPELLLSDHDSVSLTGAAVDVDVMNFRQALREDRLADAADHYQGNLLDGLGSLAETFDAWLTDESRRLRHQACEACEGLAAEQLAQGDAEAALAAGERAVALDPLRESTHRLLMQAYLKAGKRAQALQQYRTLVGVLQRELGSEPDQASAELYARIRDAASSLATEPSTPPTAASGGPAEPLDKPAIAVLPFANISDDPRLEYFSDGITEDITTDLARSWSFYVVPRNSAFAYKGGGVDLKQVAEELGAQYVVEGSVRREGEQIRITAQLVDALAGKHVWAERYDRELKNVFAVQDEITRAIAGAITPEFLSAEIHRVHRKDDRNLDAWDSMMHAYWLLTRFDKEDNAKARHYARKAMDLDPTSARALALYAVSHVMDSIYDWGPSRQISLREARRAAERAAALDDHDSLTARVLGLVNLYGKRLDDAAHYFRRAIDLDPNEAENHAMLGAALGYAGDFEAAQRLVEHALHLSPRDIYRQSWFNILGLVAAVSGKFDQAIEWARRATQANPAFPGPHRTLAACYGILGRDKEARAAMAELRRLLPAASVGYFREQLPIADAAALERYLEGLRQAGLPD